MANYIWNPGNHIAYISLIIRRYQNETNYHSQLLISLTSQKFLKMVDRLKTSVAPVFLSLTSMHGYHVLWTALIFHFGTTATFGRVLELNFRNLEYGVFLLTVTEPRKRRGHLPSTGEFRGVSLVYPDL